MSNYDLKRTVSELESQLRDIERENSALHSEIVSTVHSINNAEVDLSNYNQHMRNTLDNAAGNIDSSTNKAIGAYELQGEIDRLYTRYKSVELANKRIRALNNKKYYEFNNYRTVRKIVQGMMDNLDLNVVSEAVIYKAIEKQHLQTPDFWLTCVLISTMAWKNDDRILADKAIENSIKLDKKNSCIFYMIFNLRMGREEAAAKWFIQYQQCDLTGSDENTFLMLFSLVSKTLTNSIDCEVTTQIKGFINNLILKSMESEGYNEDDILKLINNQMLKLMTVETFDFPLLSKCCESYSDLLNMLNLANNNYNIIGLISKIINVPVDEKNTYLKEFLNDLLAKPNPSECDTYDQIEYNELIIELGGDSETAKAKFEEKKKRRECELDLVSNIISWIYNFSFGNVNGQMRLNMFTLIKELQEKAAKKYFQNYREMFKEVLPIQIDEYSADVDFTNQSIELNNIADYYQDEIDFELSEIKNTLVYISFAVGVVSCVAALFLHITLLFGLTAAGAILGAYYLIRNRSKAKNITLHNQHKQRATQETLQKLFLEFGKLKECYVERDCVSTKIMDAFAKL